MGDSALGYFPEAKQIHLKFEGGIAVLGYILKQQL
jgi:hypothetical protein